MKKDENISAQATIQNIGADKQAQTNNKTLDELLAQNRQLQSQYDTKITNSLKTAKVNWEKEFQAKKEKVEELAKIKEQENKEKQLQEVIKRAYEAEIKLHAKGLEIETLKQAQSRKIPLELVQTLDFTKETFESISSKLDIFEKYTR